MDKWVIQPICTEKHILLLDKFKLLIPFAECSKSRIVERIMYYLSKKDADPHVKELLEYAYKDKIDFSKYCNSPIVDAMEKISSYSYSSVNPGKSIQELQDIVDTINMVNKPEYDVPYINTINSNIINSIINNLNSLSRQHPEGEELKRLSFMLSVNKELFYDKANAVAKSTIFKELTYRATELNSILRGCCFLIKALNEGRSPSSWRVF